MENGSKQKLPLCVWRESGHTPPPLPAYLYELNKNQRNVVVLRECNGKSPKEVNRPIHIILNSPKTARM